MFAKNDLQHLQEIIDIENSIDQEERDLQQKHVERLTRNECTPEAGMIFSDLVSGTRACRGPCNQYCILHSG